MQKHIIENHTHEHRLALLNQIANTLAEIACDVLEPEVGAPTVPADQEAIAREFARVLDQRVPHLRNLKHAAA